MTTPSATVPQLSPLGSSRSARGHLLALTDAGVTLRSISRISRIPAGTLSRLAAGHHPRLPADALDAIYAIRPEDLPWSLVDAADTWQLIAELLAHGVTRRQIAQHVTGRAGVTRLALRHDTVTRSAAARVRDLHRRHLPAATNPPGSAPPPPQPAAESHQAAVPSPSGFDDEPPEDLRRFPLEPLLQLAQRRHLSAHVLAAQTHLHLQRARQAGLSAAQADRAAIAMGCHPDELWPGYTDELWP